jgi:ankyrin repeat protein
VNRRIIVAVVLALLLAASAYAQTISFDWDELGAHGTPKQVQAAIDNGADVNAADLRDGFTPLMCAAEWNRMPEVITVLLKAGANINAKDMFGMTALIWAARDNSPKVITILLKAGADAKAKNNEKLIGTDALKQLEEASK